MAMYRIFAKEVSESQKDLDLLLGIDTQHILPALFMSWWLNGGFLHVLPPKDPKFFNVNVNWVRPSRIRGILDGPNFTIGPSSFFVPHKWRVGNFVPGERVLPYRGRG